MVNYQNLRIGQIVYYYERPMKYWGYNAEKNCCILSKDEYGFFQAKRQLVHVSYVYEIPMEYKGITSD